MIKAIPNISDDPVLKELERAFRALAKEGPETAIAICADIEIRHPNRTEILFCRGVIALAQGDYETAIHAMRSGHEREPEWLEFLEVLTEICEGANDVNFYSKLASMATSIPFLAHHLPRKQRDAKLTADDIIHKARELLDQRNYQGIVNLGKNVFATKSDNISFLRLLARAYFEKGQFDQAAEVSKGILKHTPKAHEDSIRLALTLSQMGKIDAAVSVLSEAADLTRPEQAFHIFSCLAHLHAVRGAPEDSASSAAKANQALVGPADRSRQPADVEKVKEKIRVAYLINEWAISEFGDFIEALLGNHDRNQFSVYVFQQYSSSHHMTKRLKALVDDWLDTTDINDLTLVQIVENDRIQVTIDLCGLAAGNRQTLLAICPGPLRIGWLGFKSEILTASTDLTVLYDRLKSERQKPSGSEVYFVNLASEMAFSGASPLIESRRRNLPPSVETGQVVFGAGCDLSRVFSSASLWATVLKAVPGSALMLGDAEKISSDSQTTIRKIFDDLGVSSQVMMLETDSRQASRAYLLANIDIFLDFKFLGGGDILANALWMGIPVVTQQSRYPESGRGAAILSSAGLGNWIADNDETFVQVATLLAGNADERKSVRTQLKDIVATSPLGDAPSFAQQMEEIYRRSSSQGVGFGA